MIEHKMYKGFSIKVDPNNNISRSTMRGFYYKDKVLVYGLVDLVLFSEVAQGYLRKKLPKNKVYLVGKMSLSSVEKHGVNSLRIDIELDESITFFLDEIEVSWFLAMNNRILARVDILSRDSTSSLYNEPIDNEEDLFA